MPGLPFAAFLMFSSCASTSWLFSSVVFEDIGQAMQLHALIPSINCRCHMQVECIDASPTAAPPGSPAAEPAGWPPLLEVKSRIPTALLMSQKLPAVAEGDRAVRRLAASGDAADRHAFVRFMQVQIPSFSCCDASSPVAFPCYTALPCCHKHRTQGLHIPPVAQRIPPVPDALVDLALQQLLSLHSKNPIHSKHRSEAVLQSVPLRVVIV